MFTSRSLVKAIGIEDLENVLDIMSVFRSLVKAIGIENLENVLDIMSVRSLVKAIGIDFVCLFCCFTSQVNSYGHCGTVSSPNHTFSWAGLNKRLTSNWCTYFRL